MSRAEDMRALQAAMLKALPDNPVEALTAVALVAAQFFVVHRATDETVHRMMEVALRATREAMAREETDDA